MPKPRSEPGRPCWSSGSTKAVLAARRALRSWRDFTISPDKKKTQKHTLKIKETGVGGANPKFGIFRRPVPDVRSIKSMLGKASSLQGDGSAIKVQNGHKSSPEEKTRHFLDMFSFDSTSDKLMSVV